MHLELIPRQPDEQPSSRWTDPLWRELCLRYRRAQAELAQARQADRVRVAVERDRHPRWQGAA